METILLSTKEADSDRFMRLCEELKVSCEQEKKHLFGSLLYWYNYWAADLRLDSGVWQSEASLNQFGRWAKWEDPPAFGKALLSAGYVQRICAIYPDEISGGPKSQGLVVTNPIGGGIYLDTSFKAIHRRRANAHELLIYLTNPKKRAESAKDCHVDVALLERQGRIPKGWLSADFNVDGDPEPSSRSPHEPADQVGKGLFQVPRHAARTPTPPASSKPRPKQAKTGAKPTPELRYYIRKHKYPEPLKCLLRIDDSAASRRIWDKVLPTHRQDVVKILSGLVETNEAWMNIKSPAAIVMQELKNRKII